MVCILQDLHIFFRLRDVRTKCGPDAYSYLNLLRHLMVLLCIVTVFSIAVILPVNYNVGDQRKCMLVLSHTTYVCRNPSVYFFYVCRWFRWEINKYITYSIIYIKMTKCYFGLISAFSHHNNNSHFCIDWSIQDSLKWYLCPLALASIFLKVSISYCFDGKPQTLLSTKMAINHTVM